MEIDKPLKRHEALKPLSRQHHFGLLFCWKIRKGFDEKIPVDRIKTYASWFFMNEILPHFKIEEDYIFPVLGTENPLIIRALKEHRSIERLFQDPQNPENSLSLLEEELKAHIRFEEKVLFTEIQKVATEEELKNIEELHIKLNSKETYPDPFWEKI